MPGMLSAVDAVLRDIVETFTQALGPFGDQRVLALARELPVSLERPDPLRVLLQCQRRVGARHRAALLTVSGDRLQITAPGGNAEWWPLDRCVIRSDEVRLAGMRLTLSATDETMMLSHAMPVDEALRLVAIVRGHGERVAGHPPIARLGAAATLYDDRITFADAPERPLSAEVTARAIELPLPGTALRSVTRLMQGARGRPRQVLIDGPGWTQVAPAPETDPELADAFADAVNRRAGTVGAAPRGVTGTST